MIGTRVMHWRSLLLSAVLALGLAARGSCDASAYELCIDQSPARAGKVTPDAGTHRFSANSVVTLSAEPQPGYQFAYWLGDVADPTAQQTTVQVNAPKVIVAVFTVAVEKPFERTLGGGGGGGMLVPTALDLSSPGWTSPGGGKSETKIIVTPPIHTPEPATVLLLTLGTLALRKTQR